MAESPVDVATPLCGREELGHYGDHCVTVGESRVVVVCASYDLQLLAGADRGIEPLALIKRHDLVVVSGDDQDGACDPTGTIE